MARNGEKAKKRTVPPRPPPHTPVSTRGYDDGSKRRYYIFIVRGVIICTVDQAFLLQHIQHTLVHKHARFERRG